MPTRVSGGVAAAAAAALVLVAACSSGREGGAPAAEDGLRKIRHVVIIMQENRSFDSYFGTYPGADGIPRRSGRFTVCLPDPVGGCQPPFHDPNPVNAGAAHTAQASILSIDGGRMDGFVRVARASARRCRIEQDPRCQQQEKVDVTGYHDAREIPNYWRYAHDFVLQDHMFEPVASWSLPAHLYLVSEWSARCVTASPFSCRNNITGPYTVMQTEGAVHVDRPKIRFSWTDLAYLLYTHHVSWGYYVERGGEPDCPNDAATCTPRFQSDRTPGIWNPLPLFTDVRETHQLGSIQDVERFRAAAKAGTLPAVSWVTPAQVHSEHPPASVSVGQAWVTGLVNAVMQGPSWKSTAILVSWDDWGGFYDHVVPPTVDGNGYGLRVPGLVIGPYARRGYVDHQVLSHDAYVKFVEDVFVDGARLDPRTDGRPDPRPAVRETAPRLGDLADDFDFAQRPRRPEVLPVSPRPGPASRR